MCFNIKKSESKTRKGSTGAPKSLSVCDTLSRCKTLCFSSGKSILSRESVNWMRAEYVLGHSHIPCTSSSSKVESHLLHSWFSRVIDRVHNRAILVIAWCPYAWNCCTLYIQLKVRWSGAVSERI